MNYIDQRSSISKHERKLLVDKSKLVCHNIMSVPLLISISVTSMQLFSIACSRRMFYKILHEIFSSFIITPFSISGFALSFDPCAVAEC